MNKNGLSRCLALLTSFTFVVALVSVTEAQTGSNISYSKPATTAPSASAQVYQPTPVQSYAPYQNYYAPGYSQGYYPNYSQAYSPGSYPNSYYDINPYDPYQSQREPGAPRYRHFLPLNPQAGGYPLPINRRNGGHYGNHRRIFGHRRNTGSCCTGY